MSGYDVAVIGAGCAGLSAAVRLSGGGARVLVLEARSRLGGRATAFPDRDTGELVDNGQHVLLGCYTDSFQFLREIGAADRVRLQPGLAVTMIDREGRVSRLSCPALPPPFHLVAGVMEWDALSWPDRLSVLRMATPLRLAARQLAASRDGRAAVGTGPIAASPGETVDNWLIRNGQTARVREMLWHPLALAALNQPAEAAAAPVFARVLAEMFGGDPRAAAIALPTRPLHLAYAEPAREYIERRGGAVITGEPAAIRRHGDRVASVGSGGTEWTVGAVVSAVPWFAVADLFRDVGGPLADVLARARAMAASPIVTVNLWFDRAVMDEPFIGMPGRPMQWVFDKRAVFGAEASHLSLVSSGAAAIVSLTNLDLAHLAHNQLLDAMPAVRLARLVRATVVREPRATFSLAPGQPPRPGPRTPVEGLLLAGDWIDTGLPATIESAVRSGHTAAGLILNN